ncbi:hypothetical protein IC582_016935 [Cucumis melo]
MPLRSSSANSSIFLSALTRVEATSACDPSTLCFRFLTCSINAII